MTYLLTAIGLTTGGSSTVHIYTQIIYRTTQNKQNTLNRTYITIRMHKITIRIYNTTIRIHNLQN